MDHFGEYILTTVDAGGIMLIMLPLQQRICLTSRTFLVVVSRAQPRRVVRRRLRCIPTVRDELWHAKRHLYRNC